MKKIIAVALILYVILSGVTATAQEHWIKDENKANFARLLTTLMNAYEKPAGDDDERIDAALDRIRKVSEPDYEIANAIAGHWRDVYLDDDYPLFIYREGDEYATALEKTGLKDKPRHALVVLGYELSNGKMQPELKGRCDAAAAAARSLPDAIIVCSGGATGVNNHSRHTEAGLMRDYLVEHCGIEASRIHIDENAMTTLENAYNTMQMLQQYGIRTMTIVTSTYHQRWGQAVYNCMAAFYNQAYGYNPRLIENYSFEIEPIERYSKPQNFAIQQLCVMLDLPEEVVEAMKQAFK